VLSLILRWKFKSNTGIIADNRDSVNQSECSIEIHCSWLRINPEAYSFTTNLAHGKLITSQTTLRRKWHWYIIEKFCRNLLLLLRRNSIANDLIKEYAQTFFKINFRFLFIHLLIFIRLVQDILSFFWFFFFFFFRYRTRFNTRCLFNGRGFLAAVLSKETAWKDKFCMGNYGY